MSAGDGNSGGFEHGARRADERLIGLPDFVFTDAGQSHINFGVAETHAALENGFARHMEACERGLTREPADDLGVHARAREDFYTVRLLVQRGQ